MILLGALGVPDATLHAPVSCEQGAMLGGDGLGFAAQDRLPRGLFPVDWKKKREGRQKLGAAGRCVVLGSSEYVTRSRTAHAVLTLRLGLPTLILSRSPEFRTWSHLLH